MLRSTTRPAAARSSAVAANPTSIVEGGSATVTFTRTGGDTAQPLTVNIRVDDPDERLRGNHWDAAPVIPTEVTIPANSTTQTITLTFPDDQRDLDTAGLVRVRVLPGTDYLLQQTGNLGTFTTSVCHRQRHGPGTHPQVGPDQPRQPVHWEEGESYRTCDGGGTCTPGPAEGTFYYEDGRKLRGQPRAGGAPSRPFPGQPPRLGHRQDRNLRRSGGTQPRLGQSSSLQLAHRPRNREPLPGVPPDSDGNPETGGRTNRVARQRVRRPQLVAILR